MVQKIKGWIYNWLKLEGKRDVYISKTDAENDKTRLEALLQSAGFDLNGRGRITEVNEFVVRYSHLHKADAGDVRQHGGGTDGDN